MTAIKSTECEINFSCSSFLVTSRCIQLHAHPVDLHIISLDY